MELWPDIHFGQGFGEQSSPLGLHDWALIPVNPRFDRVVWRDLDGKRSENTSVRACD